MIKKEPYPQHNIPAGIIACVITFGILIFILNWCDGMSERAKNRPPSHIQLCRERVEARAKYGDDVDFSVSGKSEDGMNIYYAGRADMLNGYGMKIPYKYLCTVNKYTHKIEKFTLIPGR